MGVYKSDKFHILKDIFTKSDSKASYRVAESKGMFLKDAIVSNLPRWLDLSITYYLSLFTIYFIFLQVL